MPACRAATKEAAAVSRELLGLSRDSRRWLLSLLSSPSVRLICSSCRHDGDASSVLRGVQTGSTGLTRPSIRLRVEFRVPPGKTPAQRNPDTQHECGDSRLQTRVPVGKCRWVPVYVSPECAVVRASFHCIPTLSLNRLEQPGSACCCALRTSDAPSPCLATKRCRRARPWRNRVCR